MKRFFTRIHSILLVLFFPVMLLGQEKNNYAVLLKSGAYTPEENIATLAKSADLFQKSLFADKHYVTLQFQSLPAQAMRDQLNAMGIQLVDYIPNNAYTAVLPASLDPAGLRALPVRSIFQFSIEQKTMPGLLSGNIPAHAIKIPGYADVTIVTYERLNAASITPALNNAGAVILEDMPVFRCFTIRVAQQNLAQLAALPFVQWVEFIPPPNQEENLPGRSLHRVNVLGDGVRNLKGDGVNVGIWDAGEISPHVDFLPSSRLNQMEFNSPQSHSTHCSGTILGRGLIDPKARGMAPNATLYSYNYNGNIQTEMAAAIPAQNLIVSSHSYNDGGAITCNLSGTQIAYTTVSRNTDINLNNFTYHLHVHSAGNNYTSCANGWYTITGTGKSAKNNIVVGSLTSTEALSSFSSCGPVADGRIKPEITSMGTNVYSTYLPLNTYGTISGTSMSTPGVAGTVTLLVQRYKQLNGNSLPPSSLIKNAVCNTAADLGNPGPDYRFGFGRINALAAVRVLEENRYAVNTIATGGTNDIIVSVPSGATRLRVMLTWNDPAAAANANPALVNNLNLSVINGATTTLPWVLDPVTPANLATRAVDNISNIEQVTVDNPPAGTYTLRVVGAAVPTGPNQEYSLSWNIEQPYIEITYPNGNESFNPNSQELITWDNAGITGNQTVEYSLNNGGSWTTLSTTVPPSTTRYTWTVPGGANTSTALIRVSSGSINDVSDVNFKILDIPVGFGTGAASCTSGSVNFTWSAVANATGYDLYSLNSTTGQWGVLAPNITSTTYTATGLTPGASMWFTIVAKNSTTGAVSERAYAINVTVSSGGVSAIGSISGNNTICGPTPGVVYSVPVVTGATSYTWTVPPGAVIVSGQGTNSITVDYPSGSTSGNVTVFASSGSCQTSTAILSIAVTSTAVSAPTSGGNQTQTTCAANPNPTLTATATVPAGHSIVWYDAPTAGNVVVNPTLTGTGSVTYYAASVNNSTGCESGTRTAVTLTINPMPTSAITPSGATTFCQGGSVTLTATPGNSYSWSNGATSQAITVSASGTYTVTVNYGNGCSNTSAATTVTVNSIPATNITANGPTSFCQGNNVVLTATAGNSYLWSTGATTQSITVSTSGSYSVTVNHLNGCVGTSAATTVAVSPSPSVSISASPYTRLYPGLTTTLTANVTPPPSSSYTFVWMKNGNVIAGANSSTLTVSLDGLGLGAYTVRATNAGGCTNLSNALAIADSATKKLFIFPSPNTGQFKVSYHTPTTTTYVMSIFDHKGAFVYKRQFSISSPYELMDVDMRKFGKGIYHVVLSDTKGKKLADGRVVVQ